MNKIWSTSIKIGLTKSGQKEANRRNTVNEPDKRGNSMSEHRARFDNTMKACHDNCEIEEESLVLKSWEETPTPSTSLSPRFTPSSLYRSFSISHHHGKLSPGVSENPASVLLFHS